MGSSCSQRAECRGVIRSGKMSLVDLSSGGYHLPRIRFIFLAGTVIMLARWYVRVFPRVL